MIAIAIGPQKPRASALALTVQGGPMNLQERLAFETLPFAQQALQLRRWDDLAKEPGKAVPPLARYLSVLRGLAGRAQAPPLLSDALEIV
jgi:predicted HD phosphohydrolase